MPTAGNEPNSQISKPKILTELSQHQTRPTWVRGGGRGRGPTAPGLLIGSDCMGEALHNNFGNANGIHVGHQPPVNSLNSNVFALLFDKVYILHGLILILLTFEYFINLLELHIHLEAPPLFGIFGWVGTKEEGGAGIGV